MFVVTMGRGGLQPDAPAGAHLRKQDTREGLLVPVDNKLGTFALKGSSLVTAFVTLHIYACL